MVSTCSNRGRNVRGPRGNEPFAWSAREVSWCGKWPRSVICQPASDGWESLPEAQALCQSFPVSDYHATLVREFPTEEDAGNPAAIYLELDFKADAQDDARLKATGAVEKFGISLEGFVLDAVEEQ